jgi:hypothetical protein
MATKKSDVVSPGVTRIPASNWRDLNEQLMSCDLKDCFKAMQVEMLGPRRLRFMIRIHSRLNRLRAAEEREQLRNNTYKVRF